MVSPDSGSRPHPRQADEAGSWAVQVEVMGGCGVVGAA